MTTMTSPSRPRQIAVFAVLLVFTVFGTVRHLDVTGQDLSSSYFGCRIIAEGQSPHLFAHDAVNFSLEKDPVWIAIAKKVNFAPLGLLHPYVQTPLWGWSLEPVCERTNFTQFCQIFVLIFMLTTTGTIWLTARYWTAHLFHPGWLAIIYAAFYLTEPFKYAIFLVQTHMLFAFLSVAAVILARRGHGIPAGILLALAASVKITPGFLVIYWLTTRQWKASVSFVVASLALVAATFAAVGSASVLAYVHEIQWLSGVLLVAFNNQSIAAVWMTHHYPLSELYKWHIYALPTSLKLVGTLLCLVTPILGGLIDRRSPFGRRPPYGAVFTMLATTLCTPIAWSHYFILLIVPAMLILDRAVEDYREQRFQPVAVWLGTLAAIYALNIYPLFSYGTVLENHQYWSLPHSQFDSGLIALAALLLLRFGLRALGIYPEETLAPHGSTADGKHAHEPASVVASSWHIPPRPHPGS